MRRGRHSVLHPIVEVFFGIFALGLDVFVRQRGLTSIATIVTED